MTPEEAIQRAFGGKSKKQLDEPDWNRLIDAFADFVKTGTCTAVCDECGAPIEFKRIAEQVHESSCRCGKFSSTLKGI